MKVFVTGASGFVGSAVVKELIHSGHQVIGLARSEKSAKSIHETGAEVLMGSLEDLDVLQQGALQADGIIHTAFIHDFNQYAKANDTDKAAINAMGNVLIGTEKPIIITAGILGLPKSNGFITENDKARNSPRSSEITALALAEKGLNASVIRLSPSVHDADDKGFIPFIIQQAQKNGVSAYPLDGSNHWPAVHRMDAATIFRLALERAAKGALYNAVADNGIPVKAIAELIAHKLKLPLVSLSGDDLTKHFEWMSGFISFDSPATNLVTQRQLGWKPTHIGLLEDMEQNYFN
ncbi:SDR family oxidoreductase [Pedobacter heparinus]|uniref:NAD-dependent epimerase/dehydratase n=1 Tax=Pedobacter heparinus (strain ATCC 13125 / DSM 2366 / CIP 104194 / JCM 7457 / NBRC 12017 / NCIMB 9290 / NRRL B-14731 / HIM 762-3) TaxID=485917 RepID=C6XYS1_PEDHD|nr:SDR family oxidoreductase [Pedobacter heparinus]ACU04553.1 NAD-dependent epimerase/dehydratase [Pedobacter heparinus DSM 2366]